MAVPANIVVHITIPAGVTDNTGAKLVNDITFDFVGTLSPYYASIDQVRLQGGVYLRKLPDFTIASQIYQSSQEADLISPAPPTPLPIGTTYQRFIGSRNQWVTAVAARDLIYGITGLYGTPGSHVLANFSVTREKGLPGEGLEGRLKELNDSVAFYAVTLRSQGNTVPGGKPRSAFAAKGVFDWSERTPAREWFNTGVGANVTSMDFGSPTGGRGKPGKFFSAPWQSPPLINLRTGIYHGTYPLVVVAAAFPYQSV